MKKRTAVIFALILMASLLGAADVRGGAGLAPAGKTTGPQLTATIEVDVTQGSPIPGKGLTGIRVQQDQASTAVLFTASGYIPMSTWHNNCLSPGFADLQASTNFKFVGLMNGWIGPPSVLSALLKPFGDPNKAAITATNYAACTVVDRGPVTVGGVTFEDVRQILSFAAVIEFQP